MRDHLAQFSEKQNGGWGDPFYLKFWVNQPPLEKIADFEPIFARTASAVTPSEKVQLKLIESPPHAFQ